MHSLHPYNYGYFVHEPIEQALGCLGKEAGWHPQSAPFYPPDYWVSSTVGTFNVHSDRTQISSQSVTIQRNPFIYLFPILPHLQSSNPIPPRKTISNCPFWSSLTPDMVNKQIYNLNYAHLEDFPSPLTVLQTPEWGWGSHLCCRKWILEKPSMLQVPGREAHWNQEAKRFPPSVLLQHFFYWQSVTLR